jgi:hypothetical protein
VFVITPSILMEALRKACISMSSIHLLIFDEAHHCRKRHPYAQIMDYYWKISDPADRPRVFGMTASPVNTKLTDDLAIVQPLRQLETALDATLVTIADLSEMQSVRFFMSLPAQEQHMWLAALAGWVVMHLSSSDSGFGCFQERVPVLQWVPEPAKEHVKYLESGPLTKDSMLHRGLQTIFHAAFRISCVRKRLLLICKEEQLNKALNVGPESQPEYLKGNHRNALRANSDRIGFWLGNGMCHCLFHQGPYCAALLLKVHSLANI